MGAKPSLDAAGKTPESDSASPGWWGGPGWGLGLFLVAVIRLGSSGLFCGWCESQPTLSARSTYALTRQRSTFERRWMTSLGIPSRNMTNTPVTPTERTQDQQETEQIITSYITSVTQPTDSRPPPNLLLWVGLVIAVSLVWLTYCPERPQKEGVCGVGAESGWRCDCGITLSRI